ncbi:hypothetical protein TIFTF001_000524 [Ficus carica]|uniref:Uncharacterized protein n=1 Tax=Ficus carica TaxID=3494 RepID=A0AA87YXN2_FICCA|nr:hypothetical protein TIFTF001_000524 [Ficus carica]
MAPVRGSKKRKKAEKKPEENASYASGSSEKEGPLDWWDEFLRRTNGLLVLFCI